MSRCRSEVSHLAGLFCFYKSQQIQEFVWHSNSSLVPKVPNRPIKSGDASPEQIYPAGV